MVKHISDLPEEVLIEIFRRLDGNSVKKAASVCSEWNRIVSTTPAIMKKFILKIDLPHWNYKIEQLDWSDKFEEVMRLKRKFVRASVNFNEKKKGEFKERHLMLVLERFGRHISDLEVNLDSKNAELMQKILRQSPDVEKLNFGMWSYRDHAPPLMTPVRLEKLKTLVTWSNICQLIEAPILSHVSGYGPQSVDKSLEKLLKASPGLQSLEIDFQTIGRMEPNFPFKLKRLVTKFNYEGFELNDNLKDFLMSQAATVETLEAYGKDSEFLELILTNFKRLKSIKSSFHNLAASENFYRNLKPLPLLKKFSSMTTFSSDKALHAFFGNCPNLLELHCVGREFYTHLDFVAEHNKKLELLSIETTHKTNARFQHLKTLIWREAYLDQLLPFLKLHPTIEELKVYPRYVDKKIYRRMVTETNVKQVSINQTRSLLEINSRQPYRDPIDKNFKMLKASLKSFKHVMVTKEESGHHPNKTYSLLVKISREPEARGVKRKHSSSE